jgi:hypothetical protein
MDTPDFYFGQSPALYVLEVTSDNLQEFVREASAAPSLLLAEVGEDAARTESCLEVEAPSGDGLSARVPLSHLRETWKRPLDW